MRTLPAPHGATEDARDVERILLLAAPTTAELVARLDALIAGDDVAAHTAPGPRLGVVNPTPDRLALARKIVAKGAPLRGRRDIWFSAEPLLVTGGLAYVFPGLEADFDPHVEDVANLLGVSAPELSTGTVGRHAASVFAVGGLLGDALRSLGVLPDAVAGHSAGEWQAMIAGGIVSRSDFDSMVDRSDLDALRVPGVEFAVLGCAPERAAAAIEHRDGMVISHENSPNQTVVCGPSDVVADVMTKLRGSGVLCQPLPFRSGFHTPMLRPYLGPFLTDGLPSLPMRAPSLPVWSATTARPFPGNPDAIRELSVRHLLEPVRFTALIRAMHDAGVRVFVQVGAGQLGSLVDDTLRGSPHLTIAANAAHRSGIAQLRRVATAVWVEGGSPDFAALERRTNAPLAPEPKEDLPTPGADDPLARLRALGTTMPALDDLRRLLAETADAVADVVSAARGRPQPATPRPWNAVAAPTVAVTPVTSTLDVSTTAMPYLRDHCLAAQRDDWPDETDRRPVVPATTMVAHMIDAALAAAPGHVVTEVRHLRLRRWLVAAPATRVDVTVRPAATPQNRPHGTHAGHFAFAVSLGDYADAELHLAPSQGPPDHSGTNGNAGIPPRLWQPWPDEQSPQLTARQLYDERWMFHGRAFQGISRSIAIAEHGMRGEITVPEPPGALLDNLGQLIGQWLVERHPERCIAFPAEIASIRFHRPEPPPCTVVTAAIAVTDCRDTSVTVDGQISTDDGVAITVTGWRDFRIDGDERVCAVHRFAQRHALATRHRACWAVADEWPSVATREFLLCKYLAAAERAEYDQLAPTERRGWLLTRIAVKDAARGLLWDAGHGPLFPAELRVRQDTAGHYRAQLTNATTAATIHVARTHELTVAHHGPVAVTEVVAGSLAVQQTVTAAEETVLDRLRAATSDPLPVALARLAAAREALREQQHPELSDVDGPDLTLRTPDAEYRVRTDVIRNPDGLPARQHAVAALSVHNTPTGGTP